VSYQYSIGQGNAVSIWLGDKASAGMLMQPTWPDGTKWSSKAEAEAWAKAYIASQEDPQADLPGNGPDQKVIPREDLEVSSDEWAEREALWASEAAEREAANLAAEAEAEARAAAAAAPVADTDTDADE
jgi:hypothetical protein